MTKAQIVDRVAEATGLTKIETEAVIDGFLFTVMEAVKEGEMVEIRGFGTLGPRGGG
jgi:nucleoid DNA-binding protein